jgi:hypothetical protein
MIKIAGVVEVLVYNYPRTKKTETLTKAITEGIKGVSSKSFEGYTLTQS